MRRTQWIALMTIILTLLTSAAQIQAVTRDELIEKVMAAGQVVKNQDIKTAISKIEDPNGPFIWNNKINYLFLMNLEGKVLAHPFSPDLKQPDSVLDRKDVTGKAFFRDFVQVAKSTNGMGWVKYMWPMPGKKEAVEKYTFIYRIPNTDYIIGSGLYVIKAGEYY